MADIFGAIAAAKKTASRLPLISPKPQEKNNKVLLMKPSVSSPAPVYKKMDSKKELDIEIENLKNKYAPFRRRIAPEVKSARKRTILTDFKYRLGCDEDLKHFSDVQNGYGEWKDIKIPHYDGPVGLKTAYYATEIEIDEIPETDRLYLHFDGVDYIAEVYVNGTFVGNHEGFFGDFEFDITPYIIIGKNKIFITVKNDFVYMGNGDPERNEMRIEGDKLYAATGPGYDDPDWGWHHCPPGFGIYQTVYIEQRPKHFISNIYIRPLIESDEFEIWTTIYSNQTAPISDFALKYSVFGSNHEETVVDSYKYVPFTFSTFVDGHTISEDEIANPPQDREPPIKLTLFRGENTVRFRFKRSGMKLWTPDEPYLYEAQVTLEIENEEIETQSERFGMRSFIIDTEDEIKGMMYLNGVPCRLRGANTMGYEQQDVINGDFDLLLYDMLMAKACNMNFLRLTQRPVQHEIYEMCDEIGLMIQTDLPLFASMRRTKFAEGVRQAEEMEKLIRNHPSCIMISYMNEPSKNANNAPHRHLARYELEGFFRACDEAVKVFNPDRAIKYIDGDYDPPSATLPDNHCYCTWYNGHGIDLGMLYRGYWLDVKDGWYYACGEFGAEGLDPVSIMKERYPKEWMPQTAEEEKEWSPSRIKNAQSGNMHFFYYDTQDNLEDWVNESYKHQIFGTELQTGAFRRDKRMVSFAIHLFIDAWPSGWMKTIVDCERTPKPAFYTYRDLLTPLMVSTRTDRKTFFEGDEVKIEAHVCNDTQISSNGHTLRYELIKDGVALMTGTSDANVVPNSSEMQGEITFKAPETKSRDKYIVRLALLDTDGNVLHYCDEAIEVFKKIEVKEPIAVVYDNYTEELEKEIVEAAQSGKTVIIENLGIGEHTINGKKIKVKACGMRPLHFVSRKTGHTLVEDFGPYDFRLWYNEERDMITPLIRKTFLCDGMTPILTSGNCESGSAWGKPLHKVFAAAEMPCGKGKIIVNMLDVKSHMSNPVAVEFANRLYTY